MYQIQEIWGKVEAAQMAQCVWFIIKTCITYQLHSQQSWAIIDKWVIFNEAKATECNEG